MSESAPVAESDTTERWDAPSLDGSSDRGFLTAKRLQELQNQAYEEAFAEGRAAGERAGAEAATQRAARLDELLSSLAAPFQVLDDVIEEQLVDLAMLVVKQLFRREIKQDPTHVIGVVREALKLLPAASRDVEVHLHPEDAAIVRDALSKAEGERAWKMIEDPLITRGGCRVQTPNSQVDAQTETRLHAAISAIVGDERQT